MGYVVIRMQSGFGTSIFNVRGKQYLVVWSYDKKGVQTIRSMGNADKPETREKAAKYLEAVYTQSLRELQAQYREALQKI